MKTYSFPLFYSVIVAIGLGVAQRAPAQDKKPAEPAKEAKSDDKKSGDSAKTSAAQKPLPTDPEERFKVLFNKATLSGRWAKLEDGQLGEERTGDKYNVVGVVKVEGDKWTVNAKMKYGEREFTIPIPVTIKFSGDTTILSVDNLSIPNGGTYTARLLIYERTYSGTWKGQRGGGMLYGTISNEAE